jgi:hypothetical protein
VGGEWYYDEYARGSGVSSLGMDDKSAPGPDGQPAKQALPPADDEKEEHPGPVPELTSARRSGGGLRLKAQRLAGLLRGVLRSDWQRTRHCPWCHPLRTVITVVEATRARGHPDLVQGFLQVDDDLAAVANTSVTMPPVRWLSMSASDSSLMRSHASSNCATMPPRGP